jgi:hypothetical protein
MNKFNKVMIPVIITFSMGNVYLKHEENELHSEQMIYADDLGTKLSSIQISGNTQTIIINKSTYGNIK